MPKFVIHHVTKYNYPMPVRESANQIMLFPLKDAYQSVENQRFVITGEPELAMFKDFYGNEAASFSHVGAHTELRIDSIISIKTEPVPLPTDGKPVQDQWKNLQEIKGMSPFIDFLRQEVFEALPEVKRIADIDYYKSISVFTAVKQLNEYVFQNFKYIKGITSVTTTANEVWKLRAGVCQDFAHILLVMFRLLGIPARYVSGYVCPRENNLRGEGATHAWVEAYIPFHGWLGLDPTNNCIVNDLHVRLAIGRSFSDCSPVKGTYRGTAKQTLEVGVSVSHEDGSSSKDIEAIIIPQAVTTTLDNGAGEDNSYRRYMQMVQQQQQ